MNDSIFWCRIGMNHTCVLERAHPFFESRPLFAMTLTGTFPSTMSKVSISLRGMCFLRNCLYCLELSFSVACQVENAGGLKGSLR